MKKVGLFTLLILLGHTNSFAATFTWAEKSGNYAAICSDSKGNLYTTAGTPIIKYNSAGKVLKSIGNAGTGSFTGLAIKADSLDNIYLAGEFTNIFKLGTISVTSKGSADAVLVKMDSTGKVLWMVSGGGTGIDQANALSVDNEGNAYLAGEYYSASAFFGSQTITGTGLINLFTAKYDKDGTLQWIRTAESTNQNNDIQCGSVAVDQSGNCYVAGSYYDSAYFNGKLYTTVNHGSNAFIACYSGLGSFLWFKQMANSGVASIQTDKNGNLYTTGYFGPQTDFDNIHLEVKGNGMYVGNIFVSKMDASGKVIWANRAGSDYSDNGAALVLDASNNIYVTGSFSDTADFGNSNLVSNGEHDFFVAKYDNNGNKLWVVGTGGEAEDGSYSLCLNPAQTMVYIIGSAQIGPIKYGNQVLPDPAENGFDFIAAVGDIDAGIEPPNQVTGLEVYPNPSAGNFNIHIDETISSGSILHIIDMEGHQISEQQILPGQNEVFVDNMQAGMYLLSIENKNVVMCKKLIVQ